MQQNAVPLHKYCNIPPWQALAQSLPLLFISQC